MSLSIPPLLVLFSCLTVVLTQNITYRGVISDGEIGKYPGIKVLKESLISVRLSCFHEDQGYTTAFLRRSDSHEILMFISTQCGAKGETYQRKFSSYLEDLEYDLIVAGADKTTYNVEVYISLVRLELDKTATHTVRPGVVSIHTFRLPDFNETNYRYVDVTVDSTDVDVVGKLIVTQSNAQLYTFLTSPNHSTSEGLRLSFSTFGRVILSDVSKPKLSGGLWIAAVVLLNNSLIKDINITVEYNTDYEYISKIWVLLFVSLFGFILPIFSRYIFNYLNVDREVTLEAWLQVVGNWFYRGNKGLSYLTGFLAWMLLVSAFQVVNAKWGEMIEKGDRDICYYNERCYRPYLGYYDVSVNGIASNMSFMVHGMLLIISISFSETSCYSLKHKNYDYSIAYSFGLAFIFEGFGSLLYHICPSQIIFQFDTLFMFVISQYIIAALVDGHAARKDIANAKFGKMQRKSIRFPKLFLFFLGPAYGFNFIGNLHYIAPLPRPIAVSFFVSLGVWVFAILIWAAYKAHLLPDSYFLPPTITFTDEENTLKMTEKMSGITLGRWCTIIGFIGYSLIVFCGFILVLTGDLVISIFILGELVVAVLLMTSAAFVGLLKDLWTTIRVGNRKISKHMKCLIPSGIILYLLCGMLVGAVSLFFFTILEVTNKSLEPWQSRELNDPCILNNFYDSHDLWHFFASHALMMIILVVVQMSKPCRDCYMKYKAYDHVELIEEGRGGTGNGKQEKNSFQQEPVVLKVISLS